MRRVLLAGSLCLGLVGCGSRGHGGGTHHDSCSGPGTCAAGNYCARTDDGDVCWPDTLAPNIRGVAVECSANPCRRDSSLVVTATVEDESATGRAWVELDVDPGTRWEMAVVSGSSYRAEIPLDRGPFPYFEHDVLPVVQAIDEAQNPASTQAGLPFRVTRAKWAVQLETGPTPLTSPAVLPDGTLVLAGSKLYFVGMDGAQTREAVPVGASALTGPLSVGNDAIWFASRDGRLHKLTRAGAEVSLAGCRAVGPLLGSPLVVGDRAIAMSLGVEALVAMPYNACTFSNLSGTGSSPAAMDKGGRVYLGTGGTLRSLSLATNGVLSEVWTDSGSAPPAPAVGDSVQNAPVMGQGPSVWTIARNGAANRTGAFDAVTTTVANVTSVSAGGIVLADDSLVVSDAMGRTVRVAAGGTPPWPTSEQLEGTPQVGLALNGSTPTVLVPTSTGDLYLLQQSDLSTVWTLKLSALSLQPANVTQNPGGWTSTAYLASEDGKLYAIIVDGVLDTSAPWPKAFHDTRNTSNAGELP